MMSRLESNEFNVSRYLLFSLQTFQYILIHYLDALPHYKCCSLRAVGAGSITFFGVGKKFFFFVVAVVDCTLTCWVNDRYT